MPVPIRLAVIDGRDTRPAIRNEADAGDLYGRLLAVVGSRQLFEVDGYTQAEVGVCAASDIKCDATRPTDG